MRSPPARPRVTGDAPAADLPLADAELDQADDQHHEDDEHGAVGDGDAEIGDLHAPDDIGGGEIVFGADQEDHGADRR